MRLPLPTIPGGLPISVARAAEQRVQRSQLHWSGWRRGACYRDFQGGSTGCATIFLHRFLC
jgi:hypothetical protein